jgi:hypothetical protein
MSGSATTLVEIRRHLAVALDGLRDLSSVLFQCPNGDVGELLGEVAELTARGMAGAAAVTAEAEHRGLVEASQNANTTQWVAEHGWHLRRQAGVIAKTAKILRRPDLADVADSVLTCDVDLPTAVTVAGEYDKLAKDLREDAKPVVVRQMLDVGAEQGPSGVHQLTQEILARYGEQGEFEEHQERCRRQLDLSAAQETAAGLHHYEMTLDNEARAILEAAIGPLSAPRPPVDANGQPTGEPDLRSVGRRRAEALIHMLGRGVTVSTAAEQAGHPTASPKAVLMVTMTLDDLRDQTGAGVTIGPRGDGILLAPDVVRTLACNAGIIPVVLGDDGNVLNQGREKRLFTIDQIRAMARRDRGCSFNGCTAPAHWTDAHHLHHWADGGPTDVEHGALL